MNSEFFRRDSDGDAGFLYVAGHFDARTVPEIHAIGIHAVGVTHERATGRSDAGRFDRSGRHRRVVATPVASTEAVGTGEVDS